MATLVPAVTFVALLTAGILIGVCLMAATTDHALDFHEPAKSQPPRPGRSPQLAGIDQQETAA